jgi:hypothetical protein
LFWLFPLEEIYGAEVLVSTPEKNYTMSNVKDFLKVIYNGVM